MARGKRGPTPDALDEPIEDQQPLDPTAEEIVGKENVVDVGTVDLTQEQFKEMGGYICSQTGCKFTTPLLSEMEAHASETGHGAATEPVQPELFSHPGLIHKWIDVPMEEAFLNEKRVALADLYQKVCDTKSEKKFADANFNAKLATFDERMQEISRILQHPYTSIQVDSEWRVIEGENARGLFRLDTGEMIGDKEPLTMEDKIAEEAKAAADNAPAVEAPVEETQPA